MVLLDAARHSEDAPPLAWWLLGSGIAVTLAANVTYGAQTGARRRTVGRVARARFRRLLRAAAAAGQSVSEAVGRIRAVGRFRRPSRATAETAALASLRATLAAGNPWSRNQLEARFGLTRAQATKVRELVLAEANGHATEPEGEPPPTHP